MADTPPTTAVDDEMQAPVTIPAAETHAAAPLTTAMAVPEAKPASTKGRGKRLTDAQRMQIIARLEDKTAPLTRAECARLYGVSPAAIGKLMKVSAAVKKRYTDAGADAGHLRDKRQRGGFSKNMCFEDELFKWICSIRARRIPLLVAHVQQKAKLLAAKHLLHDEFKASNGWYYRFCTRYGLVPGSLHSGGGGRAGDSNVNASGAISTISGDNVSTTARAVSARASVGRTVAHHSDPAATASVDTSDSDASKHSSDAGTKVEVTASWSGESDASDQVGALQRTVAQYGPEFVYTLSEARLFYKLLPPQLVPPITSSISQQQGGDPTPGDESDAVAHAKGSMERVMVLVCANGTGTHKIPLLVVGKQSRPSCFGTSSTTTTAATEMQVGATRYFSQGDVWCDNQTFQFWCARVFAPAIAARTTHPVLLLLDNPAGSLETFSAATIATLFLPTRPGSLSASLQYGAAFAHFQPLQHGVIRELKRRYKVALFHEALSFLERSDEERYRLRQRALKRPRGAAGLTFGQLPHVGDAMTLLEEAWAAIPQRLLHAGWTRSQLHAHAHGARVLASSNEYAVEVSDDTIVLELCSMLQRVKTPDELQGLSKEIRLWLYADDDSSERMQQELLHEVQRLLQEEESKCRSCGLQQQQQLVHVPSHHHHHVSSGSGNVALHPSVIEQQQQPVAGFDAHGPFANLMQTASMVSLPLQPTAYVDASSSSSSSSSAMGFAYAHHAMAPPPQQQQMVMNPMSSMHLQLQHHSAQFARQLAPASQQQQSQQQQPQQNQHQPPPQQQQQQLESVLREQRKSVNLALRALSNAEEALDNTDVITHFGDDAVRAASMAVTRILRQLRRIHRDKQSELSASTDASQQEPPRAHSYFY